MLRPAQGQVPGLEEGQLAAASSLPMRDFGDMPVHRGLPPAIQTKLAVSSPGDAYEQEADRVAEQVMRSPGSPVRQSCSCAGGCSRCRHGQRSRTATPMRSVGTGGFPPAVATHVNSLPLPSAGQPLDAATRAFMEPRFGRDFSAVRIHAGQQAAHSARSINALAYTLGHHIVFDEGQYRPTTSDGQRLLAHELTHVLQQTGDGKPSDHAQGVQVQRKTAGPAIQRFEGCSAAQTRMINHALARARRRSTRALHALEAVQGGHNHRAAAALTRHFGTLSAEQMTIVHDRMQAADARLHDASVWRCDTEATYAYCGPPHGWCAGTMCPTSSEPTHLCPPVFEPESAHACAEPSRAILLEHEALRAAGACGGVQPPGSHTPPASLENVYSYSRFMYSIASARPDPH